MLCCSFFFFFSFVTCHKWVISCKYADTVLPLRVGTGATSQCWLDSSLVMWLRRVCCEGEVMGDSFPVTMLHLFITTNNLTVTLRMHPIDGMTCWSYVSFILLHSEHTCVIMDFYMSLYFAVLCIFRLYWNMSLWRWRGCQIFQWKIKDFSCACAVPTSVICVYDTFTHLLYCSLLISRE